MSAALRNEDASDDIGTRLKLVRQIFGFTQRELARRAGVTNGAISLIEQNRVSPSISSLKKILDGIPLSLADFFTLNFSPSDNVFFRRRAYGDLLRPGHHHAHGRAAG
jgi:transcriptional regulator with XRE-family HTH domain